MVSYFLYQSDWIRYKTTYCILYQTGLGNPAHSLLSPNTQLQNDAFNCSHHNIIKTLSFSADRRAPPSVIRTY